MVVGFVQLAEIVLSGKRLVGVLAASVARPTAKDVSGRLQVHDEVRLDDIGREQIIESLVDEELIII